MKTHRYYISFLLILLIFNSAIAQIGTVDRTFSTYISNSPTGMTWDGVYLWYIDTTDDLIRKTDPVTGSIINSIPAPDASCTGMAWQDGYLWCSDYNADKIYKIDTTGTIITSFNVTGNARGVEYFDDHVWYVDSGNMQIYKMDPATGVVTDSIQAPAGSCRGLTYDGRYLWCADRSLEELYKIDIEHKKVIMILESPVQYTYGLAWDGECIWACGYDSNDFARVYTTGTNILSHIKMWDYNIYTITYRLAVRNTGSSNMSLETWLSMPSRHAGQSSIGPSSIVFTEVPHDHVIDQWEQRFAYYNTTVLPGDSSVYSISFIAELYNVRKYLFPDSVGTLEEIPADIMEMYGPNAPVDVSNGDYLRITDPIIQDAAMEVTAQESNLYWKVRNIHDFIIEHLRYELDGMWDNAATVLSQGHGSCSEYTYLFVAMCRAAGIPARYEAGGHVRDTLPYVDTVFHRWHQVYFPNYGWVNIDATWDDRDYPANQARYFGAVSNSLVATTISGGGSNKIGWAYNSANSNSGGSRDRTKQMIWSDYVVSVLPEDEKNFPKDFELHQNYPNPFNPETSIGFTLPKTETVSLSIYNMLGQKIRTLLNNESFQPGLHTVSWDSRNNRGLSLPSGTYLYTLATARGHTITKRMTLVK
ncbi:transglutaminase domain-containing protein [candidate division KSB1 bacterium]